MSLSFESGALLSGVPLQAEAAGLLLRPVMLSQQSTANGQEFTLFWEGEPLMPETAYDLMFEAAPNARADAPSAVVDDWQEPDRPNIEAQDRTRRHEINLGRSWNDFMASRQLFMEVVGAIPDLRSNEQAVRRLSTPQELAGFAAAYLIHPQNGTLAQQILKHASVHPDHIANIWDVIRSFLVQPNYKASGAIFARPVTLNAKTAALAEQLQQKLLELPAKVCMQIVHSTVRPAIVRDAYGEPNRDPVTNSPKRELLHPSTFFTERYCVQAVRDETGELHAVPFSRENLAFKCGAWLISEWEQFRDQEQGGTIRRTAPLINPALLNDKNNWRPRHWR